MFRSAWFSLLRAEGFSCSLEVLYGGLGISKVQSESGYRSVFSLKCWIRIRTLWIRIRNTGKRPTFFALRHISSPALPITVVIMALNSLPLSKSLLSLCSRYLVLCRLLTFNYRRRWQNVRKQQSAVPYCSIYFLFHGYEFLNIRYRACEILLNLRGTGRFLIIIWLTLW